MKGIILAGGKGTRLYPLTKVTNKHLLPVGKEPMIFHPIRQLASAGIDQIMIVTTKVFDIIRTIKPSERGEYEITSVNNVYIKDQELKYDIVKGRWVDSGTFESYFEANELLYKLNNKIRRSL